MYLCNHAWSQFQNYSITSTSLVLPLYSHTYTLPLHDPCPMATTDPLHMSIILSFGECYFNGIIQYLPFWDWAFSLSVMPFRSIQIVACINNSLLLLLNSISWYGWTYWRTFYLFIYLFIYLKNFTLFIYLLFIYGCVGSSFLCEGFLQLWQAGATLHRGARASHYRGLSCCGAQAPDAQAQ